MTTYSMPSKLIAMLTAVGLVGLGCSGAGEADPAVDPGVDPGTREVTTEVWTNIADESGARKLISMGAHTQTLDEAQPAPRELVIDGAESSDLARVQSGSEIVVPLNTGETAILARNGDRLELVSFTGEDDGTGDLPRGAVEAVRMLDEGIEVFLTGSAGDEPDTIVRVSGIEDLDAERAGLVTSLALDTLLVSLEDTEQWFNPTSVIALVAGALGVIWLETCAALLGYCAYNCFGGNGIEVKCGGVKVNSNPFSVEANLEYSCSCT
jgi:hypothetical protein